MKQSPVRDFIEREVANQGHDLSDPDDGGIRVEWMMQAWEYAVAMEVKWGKPMITCITTLGVMVEPEKNARGLRICEVSVGGRRCPTWTLVPTMLRALIDARDEFELLEFYRQFQLIHPFRDGNGRVGKIIYNWLLGKLDDPEMPPDLFGGGVP